VRDQLAGVQAPRLAVSPIVAGQAIKGPTAKLMAELGADVDVTGVARHYRGLIDRLVIDTADAERVSEIQTLGLAASVTPTIMKTQADRETLAQTVLAIAGAV
jgi:LPPG:FO 2-phospho-L-lactate transferase